ncbi:MAG: hypothetical protein CMJ76_11550 [Planctomycetaceae bacterium]|nr:hypothetical protein [Planctomycetaceae bacterium]
MKIPSNLVEEQQLPQPNYPKSTFTWISLGATGITLVPFILFVIDYIDRISNRGKFLEFLGESTSGTLNGTQDFLAYVLTLMLAVIVVGTLAGMIGSIIMVAKYNKEHGFLAIRFGMGAAIGCQGILVICTCVIWVANALSLYNGDKVDENGVRIVATTELLTEMSANVFGNNGMIWGVWILLPPIFMALLFAEKDLARRSIKHV